MSEVQSAITQVTPSRGRRPFVLKDGTTLSDARKTARQAVIDAKTMLRAAKTALRESSKKAKGTESRAVVAEKQLEKVKGQRFATQADKKLAVGNATEASKTAKSDAKAAAIEWTSATKAVTAAAAAVAKAETARLKVEEKYQASKSVN